MNDKTKSILDQIIGQSKHLSWMKNGLCYLTVHGSHAYNTNVETSDWDYKGVCVPTLPYYIGSQHRFEQAELKDPDTVIYELRKFITLASNANPNTLEILFTDPEDHLFVNEIGKTLLDHKERFLSKRIRFSMGGYAHNQLKRIQLHRGYLLNKVLVPPSRKEMGLPEQTLIPQDQMMAVEADIEKELNRYNFDFMEGLDDATKIAIKEIMSQMLVELKITAEDKWMASARKVGLSDNFIEIMQKERAYKNLKSQYDKYQEWKKNRNPVRAAMEEKFGFDGKHGLHLIRLLRMCKEILETGKVIVKRPDKEELIAIRNGFWSYDELIEQADKLNAEIDVLYKSCSVLPHTPDFNFLDKLCVGLIQKCIM